MKLLPDGKTVVAAMSDDTIAIIEAADGTILRRSEALGYSIEGIAVAPKKGLIIVGGGGRLVFLGLSDFRREAEIAVKSRIFQIDISPNQEKIAVAQAANEALVATVSDSPKAVTWLLPSFGYAVGWLPEPALRNQDC